MILGDTIATLGAVMALRSNFDGHIIVIPNSLKHDNMMNTKFMRESLEPKPIKDLYMVDLDFLDKNYVKYVTTKTTDQIVHLDADSKRIHFSDGEVMEYTKVN